jgi:hypothetical protein
LKILVICLKSPNDRPAWTPSRARGARRGRAAASSVDPALARAGIAEGLALSLGAMVFGPWIRAALGLDADEFERIRDQALERIFTRLDTQPA